MNPAGDHLGHGRSSTLRAVAALAVLCGAGRSADGGTAEFEGFGEVRVVGGNEVSARGRALRAALRQAVAEAVGTMLVAQRGDAEELKRRVLGRHEVFVRSYRVLSEGRQGQVFRIEVAVSVWLERLRQELQAGVGGSPDGSPTASGRPEVGVWIASDQAAEAGAALQQRLQVALRAAGFETQQLGLGPGARSAAQAVSRLRALARARGAAMVLIARVDSAPAEGVRGIELAGARARVELELALVDGTILAATEGEGWGAAEAQDGARRIAAGRALDRGLVPVVAALGARWPEQVREDVGGRVLRVSGLASYGQMAAVWRALDGQVAGVRGVRPRRLDRGEAWFAVSTGLSPELLIQRLEAQRFGDFALRRGRSGDGALWLEVSAFAGTQPVER